jgi:hypothetical protein
MSGRNGKRAKYRVRYNNLVRYRHTVRGSCRQGAIRTRLEQDRLVRETNP